MKHETTFPIDVTRECIDNSVPGSPHWCIIALATNKSIPGAMHTTVDKNEVRFTYQGFRYVFPTPDKSARIAEKYDCGKLTKAQIQPWKDILKDAISIEPSRVRRPRPASSKRKKAATVIKSTEIRCSRWNGESL